jgi:hypothetical protein
MLGTSGISILFARLNPRIECSRYTICMAARERIYYGVMNRTSSKKRENELTYPHVRHYLLSSRGSFRLQDPGQSLALESHMKLNCSKTCHPPGMTIFSSLENCYVRRFFWCINATLLFRHSEEFALRHFVVASDRGTSLPL